MLEIRNLSIKIIKDDRYLIKDLNLSLNQNDKLAIIGEEGNGKSTLLKAIYDKSLIEDYCEVKGTINSKNIKLGYLEQFMNNDILNMKVSDYIKNTNFNKFIYKELNNLNISSDIFYSEQIINTLSGGEKVKLQIVRLLLDNPDIYLLDEPTNDLDIDTLNWLENFINNTTKPIIYISHDETLLENTANVILHLEQIMKKTECKHTLEKTNYKDYVETRINAINKQTQVARMENRKRKEQLEILNEQKQKVRNAQLSTNDPNALRIINKKMKNIKALEKRYENTELTKVPDVEESINLFFENVTLPAKKVILNLKLDELKIDNKVLSKNIELNIYGKDKICIIGDNGVGKTTLLKYIYNELKDRTDIKVGYMPQDYEEEFKKFNKPLDFLSNSTNKEYQTLLRTYMGNLNITTEEMMQPLTELSGGTKAKLMFLKLIIDKNNILILDEPTRNLSPLSNPKIREILINYGGVIISISHDRKYINEVCTGIYKLTKDKLIKAN